LGHGFFSALRGCLGLELPYIDTNAWAVPAMPAYGGPTGFHLHSIWFVVIIITRPLAIKYRKLIFGGKGYENA
jgi:hypothetical protein